MTSFLIRRIATRAPRPLAGHASPVFALFFVAPNNVARTLAGRQATPETIALIEHRLGLDQPVWKQYLDFLGNALHGDLGYDYYHQVPVTTIISAGTADHALPRPRSRRALADPRRLQRRHLGRPAPLASPTGR